jgi:hypothetical protein
MTTRDKFNASAALIVTQAQTRQMERDADRVARSLAAQDYPERHTAARKPRKRKHTPFHPAIVALALLGVLGVAAFGPVAYVLAAAARG